MLCHCATVVRDTLGTKHFTDLQGWRREVTILMELWTPEYSSRVDELSSMVQNIHNGKL